MVRTLSVLIALALAFVAGVIVFGFYDLYRPGVDLRDGISEGEYLVIVRDPEKYHDRITSMYYSKRGDHNIQGAAVDLCCVWKTGECVDLLKDATSEKDFSWSSTAERCLEEIPE